MGTIDHVSNSWLFDYLLTYLIFILVIKYPWAPKQKLGKSSYSREEIPSRGWTESGKVWKRNQLAIASIVKSKYNSLTILKLTHIVGWFEYSTNLTE
jgi:hypothetical protein